MASDITKWKPWQGRISLFPTIPSGASPNLSALDLYKQVWNGDPDNFQKQSTATSGFVPSVAQGTQHGLAVTCSVFPIRIDIGISPHVKLVEPTMKLIEDTRQFQQLLARIVEWAKGTENTMNRAALFAQFAAVTANYHEANRVIRSVLPKRYALELSDEEDFVLQFNEPRREGDTVLNFITKWAVERVQTLSFQGGSSNQLLAEHFLSSVSFDNNNLPTTQLSKPQVATVLDACWSGVLKNLHDLNLSIEGF